MKKFSINWMNVLAGIMLAGMFACSENELEQMQGNEEKFSSRNALISESVTMVELTDSLELILKEKMGDEFSTLQKLVVSGPFTAADMQFVKDSLPDLEELDLKDALIKASDETYRNGYFEDNVVCRYMFYDMEHLKQIVLPSTATAIDDYAFYYCEGLTSIEIPASVNSIGSSAFYYCEGLTSIEIPASVNSIGSSAFYYCEGLTSVKLNQGLTSIGTQAFYRCSSLKTIEIPSSVTSMGNSVFERCTSLTSASLKNNLSVLPNYTFEYCTSLTNVELPESMLTIGSYAFYGCTSLTDSSIFTNVTTFKNNAFGSCGFTSFDLTGKSVGTETFINCNRLQSVVLPTNMTTLPAGLFEDCDSLQTVSLPNTLEQIGNYAFYKTGLTSIEIPASVTSIGSYAFSHSRLKELTIPATVTSVGSGFVSYCTDLMALYWNSSLEVPSSYDVDNCFLYFPSGDHSYDRSYWTNVIFDGVAENITLNADGGRATQSYGCLTAFTAKKITYKRKFSQTTYPGESSGWQTIVLPFMPTSITHKTKGVIAPFNSNVEGAKPFWLRELTSEGWKDVTAIEPDKAYLIAMPNHSDYVSSYRLNGEITFSAENVTIGVTPETLSSSVGPDYEFQPTYQTVAKAANVYALNVDYYESGYNYGSLFIRSSDDVCPYEGYVKTLSGGRSSRSVFSTDTRSSSSRAAWQRNTTGIPQIGDM